MILSLTKMNGWHDALTWKVLAVKWLTETGVQTWAVVLVVSILSLSLLIGVPLARSAGRRRGIRLARPEAYASFKDKSKDTALFLAALFPSLLVWLAVMGVSFIGLTGFANDVMNWNHWTNILVPLSLDGISVSFGAWAFVAVKRGRHPGRAYKIVLAAATVSATLNFVHGRDKWSIWAGLYLAFLSMAGMAMFHELLDQFMAGLDDELALKTRYPRFGQRWLYAPASTFAARRAWIVFPPDEGLRPSVRNALDHLEDTREDKRQRKLAGSLRVREQSQAKLIEVRARTEVARAKAAGRAATRAEFIAPAAHQTAAPNLLPAPANGQPYAQANGQPQQPPAVPQVPQQAQPGQFRQPDAPVEQPPAASVPQQARDRVSPLDPELRATIEQVFSATQNGREPMGRNPLATEKDYDPNSALSHLQEPTQRMIAEALSYGEAPSLSAIREWVQREYGERPSQEWARTQLRMARRRDTIGADADLA